MFIARHSSKRTGYCIPFRFRVIISCTKYHCGLLYTVFACICTQMCETQETVLVLFLVILLILSLHLESKTAYYRTVIQVMCVLTTLEACVFVPWRALALDDSATDLLLRNSC